MIKENKIKLIISVISSFILLIGVTYAAWSYLTEKTEITMVVNGDQISFNAGSNITASNISPVYTMNEGIVKDIEIYKTTDNYIGGLNLYLKLTSWPSVMSSASFRWALYKNGEYLSSGSFANTSQGSSIRLTSNTQKINLTKDDYKLYLWLDAYQESNINMMNKSFTVNLYGQTTFYEKEDPSAKDSTPNAPDLIDGLIPIKYDYVTDEWVKADSTNTGNDWYDYTNKKWANAVMVSSSTRIAYMNASVNTPVSEDDILAYYVWIPRYRYVLFNTSFEAVEPREIQIEFQSTTDEISSGTQNGEYLTHPAFWWDNNSDGIRTSNEELAGIWVGKFETSGYESNPRIKPNVSSKRGMNIYNFFYMHKNFESTEYLTEEGVNTSDAHMMKNTEWGVVAYLTHSKYGINKKVLTNYNNAQISGRQGNYTYNDFIIVDGELTQNKEVGTGTLTSTTGNVYGIYDLSGGVGEYMMALLKNSNNIYEYGSSGFDSTTFANVASKYYDVYNAGTSETDYTRCKLGDATGETRGWYGDYSYMIKSNEWFARGGYWYEWTGHQSGIFYFGSSFLRGWEHYGSRSVLLKDA